MRQTIARSSMIAFAALAMVAACKPGTSIGSPGPAAGPAPGSPTATAAAPISPPALPSGVTLAMVAEGKTLFETPSSNCVRCHGADLKGTDRGPNLTDNTWVQIDGSYPAIVKIINTGVAAADIKGNYQFNMRPKAGAALTDAQVNSIAAYIYSVSHTTPR